VHFLQSGDSFILYLGEKHGTIKIEGARSVHKMSSGAKLKFVRGIA
jgi:hypothetical protein